MAEILFYHLTRSRVEQALPALVQRSTARDWRVLVHLGREDGAAISDALWQAGPTTFIAHGLEGRDEADGQPVWLATGESGFEAQVAFALGGAFPEDADRHERTVVMFDGHDADAVSGARERWKQLKGEGHDLTYWQQDDEGRWNKKG